VGEKSCRGEEIGFRVKLVHSPNATVCLVLERIFSPILPYKITIITMGKAKKTHVDTSHSGNCSGFSSIAQNAESGISTFAVNEKNTPVRESIMVGECLSSGKRGRMTTSLEKYCWRIGKSEDEGDKNGKCLEGSL
jgi:hypothetical protein